MSAPNTGLMVSRKLLKSSATEGDSPLRTCRAIAATEPRESKLDANSLALANNYRKVCHAVANYTQSKDESKL